jgi:hypothetical protein
MSLNIDSPPTAIACFPSFGDLIIARRCYYGAEAQAI